MKRKLVCLLLALIMVLGAVPSVFAAGGSLNNFEKQYSYYDGRFTDVPSSAWYAPNVKNAYEYGLMVGESARLFGPELNVTIAESITMAARMNNTYYNRGADFSVRSWQEWYEPYVDYAIRYGIIARGDYLNYDVRATRQQFAFIMANALPSEALSSINDIKTDQIPDVKSSGFYGPAIYKLYRAGILAGNDQFGTFAPNSYIKRSEVAAIVTRMVNPSLRLKVTLQSYAFELLKKTAMKGTYKNGVYKYHLTAYNDGEDGVTNEYLEYSTSTGMLTLSVKNTIIDWVGYDELRVTMPLKITNSIGFEYYCKLSSRSSYTGKGNFNPAFFKSGNSIPFYSYNGTQYGIVKEDDEMSAGYSLEVLLNDLYYDVLQPNGYTWKDMGFTLYNGFEWDDDDDWEW